MWMINIGLGIIVLFLLYLLVIMPRIIHRANGSEFIGKYYAHRGFHDNSLECPENSLAAFSKAVEMGFGIELDVRLTKDKELIVFHDDTLERACGIKESVSSYTYKQLKQLELFQSKESIPRLVEVLKLVDGKVPLIIELKVEWHPTETCVAVDRILNHYKGLYCIESFSPLALIWYRKNRPNVMRGQLSTHFKKDKISGDRKIQFVIQNLLLNFLAKPDFIAYNYRYRKNISLIICRKLYKSYAFAWTIQTEESLENVRKSFDSFIFDSFFPKTKKKTSKM